MDNNEGYLTIEATLSLSVFLFFMMFIMNYGQIYMAQGYIAHGLLQTGKLLSLASYEYDQRSTADAVGNILEAICVGNTSTAQDIEWSWRVGNYSNAAERAFPFCAGKSPEENTVALKRYGIKSVGFEANIEGNDLTITATYQVDLGFPFFGYDKLTLKQQVKNGLWK